MRIPRFYLPQPLSSDTNLELPPELFRHAIQVLRMKQDEPLILFNGAGGEYTATLTEVSRRSASVHIASFDPVNRESILDLTLIQSIIKPDRMDLAIQKSTELGVTRIQPLISQRSIVRPGRDQLEKKQKHWQAVAISACEQSGRTRVPEILPTRPLATWLQVSRSELATRLMLLPGDYPPLQQLNVSAAHNTQAFSVMIGPEGGFTDAEEEQCLISGLLPVSLGPRVLRAETAALTAIALLQQQFGDL